MAESSSASERSRSPSPARAVTGPKSSRTFVWLRELPKAIPRGKPWDQLNRDGRVKEIEFGKKFSERQMRDLVRQNFTELEQADFKRIRLYKSGSRGSVLKRVAKNVPDASTLLHKFSGGSSKRVYILFKSDDENEGGPNSRTEPSTTPTVTDNADVPPTLPLPRGGFSTRQYITSLAESSRTQETDNDFTLSPRTDTFQGEWTPASPRSTGHSNINPVIQLTIEDDADLLQSPFDNSVIALDPIQDEIEEETTKLKSSKGVFGTPFYGEGTKVGTVAGDMSPNGLGEESSLPSRTNEVVRCEKRLLASCRGENTSLPSFLVHSFEELCWQAREMNTPMGIILLNPEKENMAIREGIVRALRWLTSQNQQWLFWIAETSSVNGRSVCSMFSVRNTTDSMLFLLPSTTWKPTLVKQLHDNNLTDIDVQDRLSEIMDKTCDALKVLSAQREKLNTLRKDRAEQEEDLRRAQQKESQERKESEEKEKEKEKEKEEKDKKKEEDNDNKEKDVRSARNARVNAEPVLGSTIRVKSQNGTRQRKFKTGANFQEVYDWAGAIESFPLYFTLHRGGVLVSHAETIEQDETLNVTEREEAEMEHFFRNEVSFKGNYQYSEGALSKTLEDAETDAQEYEEDKNDGNKEVPDTSLERKKRKRKNNRTTAQRLKKRKEKEGNRNTDN